MVVLWGVPKIQPQRPVQSASTNYSKIYQRNCVSQNCPHITLPKQILYQQAPNSSMLFFEMFQRKIRSVLFKVLTPTVRKSVKVIVFPKVAHLPEQILHYYAQIPICRSLGCTKDIAVASCSTCQHELFENLPKKLCFPKLSTFNTAQANTLAVAIGAKFQYVVL